MANDAKGGGRGRGGRPPGGGEGRGPRDPGAGGFRVRRFGEDGGGRDRDNRDGFRSGGDRPGPRGGEGFRPRGPRPEGGGEGFRPRGPRPEGGEGFRPRGPRPEGGGEGFRPRGPRPEGGEGYRPRGPRPERGGDDYRPRGPRPEGREGYRPRPEGGDGYRPRGPRPEGGDGYRPRGPRPEGREGYRPRPEGGDGYRPRGPRPEGGDGYRPRGPRPEGGDGYRPRGPRSEGGEGYRPRRSDGDEGYRPRAPRKEGGESELLRSWRPREDAGGDERPRRPRAEGDSDFRPRRPRPEGDSDFRPRRPRPEGEWQDRPPRRPRPEGQWEDRPPRRPRPEGEWQDRPPRRPRPEGEWQDRPPRRPRPEGEWQDRPPRRPRPEGEWQDRPPRRPRPEGDGDFRPRSPRGEAGESELLRSWRPREDAGGEERPRRPRAEGRGEDRPREERPHRARPEGEQRFSRPPLQRGPIRRRRPDEEGEGPAAEERRPRREVRPPAARPIQPEARYEAPEPTNPHVVAAAQKLAEVDEIEVDIERLVFGGEGLGRFDGVPIFVPRSIPGERLKVRLTERRTGWGRAEIVEILRPSPERRDAPCPFFDRCGGCDLQHIDEAAQLRYKAEAVCESLVRQGGVEIPASQLEIIPGDPWQYRLRAQIHIKDTDRGRQVGYFARGSHELVAIDRCPVLAPELEAQLETLPRKLQGAEHERVDLTCGDDHAITCSPPVEALPNGSVRRKVGEFEYEIDARCFFQSHRTLVDALVEVALGDAKDQEGTAFDLYAGVGLFSLPLARRYRRVVAVEGDRVAVRFARRNVKAAELKNVAVEAISVDSFAELLPKDAARVLVDPPRVGLSNVVRRALIAARPRHITYVSCHAPTLARDLREMLKVYRLEKLSLLDMFPQTGHMEVVAQLVLREPGN